MASQLTMNVTGIDTETIIQELMKIERRPLTALEARQQAIADKKAAWAAIKDKLDSLSSKITPLLERTLFDKKAVSVQEPSVVTVQASTTAIPGSYDLSVTSLAVAQVVQSKSFQSPDQSLGFSGTLVLNGKSISVTAADSLTAIAQKINATTGVGVTASVMQVSSSDYRLILTSQSTGTANEMTFGGDTTLLKDSLGIIVTVNGVDQPNEIRAAQDAVFSVNGVQFIRSSNQVSDAIPGLTLTLLEARDPVTGQGGKTSFTVKYDDDAVVSCVKSFVDEYNSFLDLVTKYNSWDPEAKKGSLLFGDPLLLRLLNEIRRVIFGEIKGAVPNYNFVGSVGLSTGSGSTFSRDGKITLDEAKLREALGKNRDAVAILFGAKAMNVALSSNGSTAQASSYYSAEFAPDGAINGVSTSDLWGSAGGGWNDGTQADFTNDWLRINFGTLRTIDTINVYTLDSATYPASAYGIRDFSIEYYDGSSWKQLASYTGNTQGMVSASFEPVTTDSIRIVVKNSNDGQYSRITEVEAFNKSDGVFNILRDTIQKYTAYDGFLDLRQAQLDSQDKSIARQIENLQRRLDMRLASLRRQFTALETMLMKMNSQGLWLAQQIQGFSTNA
ncbi:MAG TPA: flagellar filament capping protein FliD [Firmicutes bacterium]|nr:flagellar filament capping protein FliD [Candidatus Fermentithermobacillaceae bacterium]